MVVTDNAAWGCDPGNVEDWRDKNRPVVPFAMEEMMPFILRSPASRHLVGQRLAVAMALQILFMVAAIVIDAATSGVLALGSFAC